MTLSLVLRTEGKRPLTVNKVAQMHRMSWASHTKRIRRDWENLARKQVPPVRMCAASMAVTPLHENRRSPQDAGACAPEAKAAIDGLVDAGVIPDDSAPHLVSLLFLPPRVCGVDGMEISVTEVPT